MFFHVPRETAPACSYRQRQPVHCDAMQAPVGCACSGDLDLGVRSIELVALARVRHRHNAAKPRRKRKTKNQEARAPSGRRPADAGVPGRHDHDFLPA